MTEIRTLPQQDERVESGVVQFGDDWPGVFIRGDHAFQYAMHLEIVIAQMRAFNHPITVATLEGLLKTLQASRVTHE